MKHLKKIIIIILIISGISLYLFGFNMKASSMVKTNVRDFDSSGFTEASGLSNTNSMVATNDNFELYIDETTSYFRVVDLRNNEVYYSNPVVQDPWELDADKNITPSALAKQKATMEIQYFNQSGSLRTVNNYNLSIYHKAGIINPEGERTFGIKYITDGVQVKYTIEDLEIDYLHFPKYVTKEFLEARDDFSRLNQLAYTGYDEDRDLYEIVLYEGMTRPVRSYLYRIFYEELDYTRERAIEENESYGYFEQVEKIRFEIAIEIKLTDEGVQTTILRDSIVETEVAKISKISLYPLFGNAVSVIGGNVIEDTNQVIDGTFEFFPELSFEDSAWAGWNGDQYSGVTESEIEIVDGELVVDVIYTGTPQAHATQIYQEGFAVENGKFYRITFDARADEAKDILVAFGDALDNNPWFIEFVEKTTFNLTTSMQTFTLEFEMTEPTTADQGKLVFELATAINTKVYIDNVLLEEIDALTGTPSEGYIVLPDGSGAIIDFNNGKYFQNAYNKRLYGADLALLPYKMAEQQQKISMPVYGMVKENGGFAAIITEGDAMAWITADISGRIDSYNKVYISFSLREVESVVIGSGFNRYGVDLWTKEIVHTDFTVEYKFLDGEDNSYVGIAKTYQKYLIENYGLEKQDQTTDTVLTAEFIGSYDRKEFFLGVPYYTNESMTTFEEAQIIIDLLRERNIKEMNVLYQGAINGGLSQDLNDRVDFEKTLGGKKDYKSFEAYLNSLDIDIYQSVNLMTAKDYHKSFDQYRYTASRIRGSHALMFNYHYPSRLPYSETNFEHTSDAYIINPLYYEAIFNRFNKDYAFDHIEFSLLGSMITGHYSKSMMIYQQDSMLLQQRFLETVDQNMMFKDPLYYAFSHASYITDIPVEATLYSIIDHQIPLLQLVLSGYVDYSSQSINLANNRSVNYQFLKLIESGSNLKYTLTYEDSRKLLNTEYNYYMSTDYRNWLDVIEEQIEELDTLGIHQGHLVNHEIMLNNVYRVTYSNGLIILINYNLRDVTVGSYIVPSLGYIVEGV